MTPSLLRPALSWLAPAAVCLAFGVLAVSRAQETGTEPKAVQVEYLEIVTPDVDATCGALEELQGVRFGEPVAALGGARTAALEGGGRLAVRAPMHAAEEPVVRPYLLVDDVAAAAEAAVAAGGEIMIPPTELPDQGTFALYLHGGIQHGLWQD